MKALWVALVLLLVLAGCGGAADTSRPPPIKVGRDVSSDSGMVIDDVRFAAAYYAPDGEARKFHDLGDLVQFLRKSKEVPPRIWVHDFETRDWLEAQSASYVVSPEVKAPHHGIAAFRSEAAARAFAQPIRARVLTWPELLALDLAEAVVHQP